MNASQPKRSWRKRIARAAAALSIAFIALLAATWFFIIPALVQQRIDDLLRVYEPNHRAFRIESIGWSRATIADVRLGAEPWLNVRQATVRFGIRDLLRGRIDELELQGATWRIAVRDGVTDWGFVPSDAPRAAGLVRLPVDVISLKESRIEVDVDGLRIAVPVEAAGFTDSLSSFSGRLTTSDIAIGDQVLPKLAGDFSMDGEDLVASLRWPLIESEPMSIGVGIEVDQTPLSGLIRIRQAAVDIDQALPLISRIASLDRIDATGRAALDGELRFGRGEAMKPLVTLRFGEVMASHPGWPLAIASATGVVTFDSLSPLRTQGPQRIRIDSATTGELEISAAELRLELQDAQTLRVHEARWFMNDGGRYAASPATIDLNLPRIVSRISGENIDLDFWLRLLTSERADGSGRLRGEFAVDWNPRARPRIQFTGGSLVATPPTGFIRVHDAPMLGEMLDQSDPRFTVDQTLQTVKQRIIEALTDLGFTRLSFDFIPDGRDTTLRANLEGQGRRGEHAQQFSGLVVNIGHFAQTLQEVLNSSSAKDGLSELISRPRKPLVPAVGAPQAEGQ